jgi:hypothetical protein
LKIENYGLVDDGHTAALGGKGGSIGWLYLAPFGAPDCFTASMEGPGSEEKKGQ